MVIFTYLLKFLIQLICKFFVVLILFNKLIKEIKGGKLVGQASATVALSGAWQQGSASYAPLFPGLSQLDVTAYVDSAPLGYCFFADDVVLTLA